MIKKVSVVIVIFFVLILITGTILSLVPKSVQNSPVSGIRLQSERWSGTITIRGDTKTNQ